jgi:tetratricopeptide (TPR) repeat protein
MASLEPGKRLADRYVLLERLGDGGHAEVWAAQDESGGARVALKFMHLRSCSVDEALVVLRHEAQMMRRLDHPCVLRVEEPLRDGWLVFLPMEYAGGGDAAQLRGAPWQRLLPVLLQVAQVLEHAHSRGVVHRDIKPGNVLFDVTGAVRVTDFGTSSRMGSTAAMAAGSPFSASPQQLRGDAAATSDDVYGLGALAYELLSRYPPYYPQFDLQRVQHEDPPRPVPVHAAPAALVDLIQSMLARDAKSRPDLRQVSQALEDFMAAGAAEQHQDGALVVEPQADVAAPAKQQRRYLGAVGWLAAAAGLGTVAFLLLSRLPAASVAPLPAAPIAPPATVSAAVVERDAPPPPVPDVGAPLAGATLPDALRAAANALTAGQPAQARAAFQRALVLDPDNAQARQGLKSVESLDRLLVDFAAATRIEASGDLQAARAQYQQLVSQHAGFAPAAEGLARVQGRQRTNEFELLLSQGAAALRQGQLGAAEAAYSRAAAMFPGEARVADGQARLAEVLRNQRNADDLARGAALEDKEQWQEAVAHYQTVLTRDASLLFAQDGVTRSNRRAALDAELADYLTRRDRLAAPAVRVAAERALARGEATSPQTSRLTSQLAQLKASLQALTVPVRLAITSDNSTVVSVAPVGQLGAFSVRELDLAPGRYTVIGRRDGFRDVRLELDLAPGQRDAAVSVQCTERI